ncbi:MAG: lysophospholipid acyltransferase family protein [Bacteroidales bacterium]
MKYLISIFLWFFGAAFVLLMFPLSFLLWFIVWPFDGNRVVFHWWLTFKAVIVTWLLPAATLKFEGREKIKKGHNYIIISNHQSILDILILYRLQMNFKWISKIENTTVPILGWYLKMAGYIPVDRDNKESKAEMIKTSAETLRRRISIMIFPEGTRSPDGEVGRFRTGAFELALMTDKPILPVVIEGTGQMLPKHRLIFNIGKNITVRVLEPLFPGSFGTSNPEELAGKFRALITGELYKIRSALQ